MKIKYLHPIIGFLFLLLGSVNLYAQSAVKAIPIDGKNLSVRWEQNEKFPLMAYNSSPKRSASPLAKTMKIRNGNSETDLAVASDNRFSATLTPDSVNSGTTTSVYKLIISNLSTGDGAATIGSVVVTIPEGFADIVPLTITTFDNVNNPFGFETTLPGFTYGYSSTDKEIRYRSLNNSLPANTTPAPWVEITFQATNPTAEGSYTFETRASSNQNYTLTGINNIPINPLNVYPQVEILPCAAPLVTYQPSVQDITYGSNATFTFSTSSAINQWQVSTDGTNFADILDVGVYSGATTGILLITSPPISMSGYLYRCLTSACNPGKTIESNIVGLSINKAPTTTTVTATGGTYSGSPFGASAAVTGAGGFNQTLTVTYLGTGSTTYAASTTAPGNAGTYSATATYAGSASHLGSTDTKDFTIGQSSATTLTLTNLIHSYDGNTKSAGYTIDPSTVTGVTISNNGQVNANTYSVTASLSNVNYSATPVTGDLVIAKAPTTTTVTAAGGTYSGSPIGASAKVMGAGGLDEFVTVSYSGTGSTSYGPSTTAPSNAGNYSAAATYAESANHLGSSDTKDFTIGQYSATTLNLTNLLHIYDGNTKSAGYTIDPSSVTGVTIGNNGQIDANTYSVTASLSNANYSAPPVTGDLVIAKAPTTTTVTAANATYSGSPIVATANVTGAGELNQSLSVTYLGTGSTTYASSTTAPSNAGTYSANATYAESANHLGSSDTRNFTIGQSGATTLALTNLTHTYDGITKSAGYIITPSSVTGVTISNNGQVNANTYSITASLSNANYSAAPVTGNLVIAKAPTTTTVTAAGGTYSGSPMAASANVTGAGALNQTLTVTYLGTVSTTYASSTTAPSNAGTYSATATYAGSANHLGSTDTKNFTIGQSSATSITLTNLTHTYDGTAKGATVTTSPAGLTVTVTYDGSANLPSAAGNYAVIATINNSNYTSGTATGTLVIGTRPITISADPKSKTYGEADPNLSYQITSGSLATNEAFTGSLSRNPGENAGTYAINLGTLTPGSNYSLSFTGNNLTINQKTIPVSAVPKCKIYGQTERALTYTYDSGLLIGSDAFSGSLTRDPGLNVGTYLIKQGTLTLGANYNLVFTGANYCIVKKAVAITATATNKTYGDADPALTYTFPAGSLVGSDTFSGSLTRDAGENIGTYAIRQGTVALSTNYTLTYAGANLTIGTRTIRIAADPKNKTYGDTDPALTYQISSGSLATGDSFTGILSRAAGNEVGSYAISQGTVALNSNYALSFTGANLTIGTRAISLTADAQSKTYGDADPALTYQITGGTLAAGEAFTGSPIRAAGNNVGSYIISQGSLALNGNYALNFTGSILTIGTRAISIAADAQSKTYGAADPALTYQITSGTLATGDAFTGSLSRAAGDEVGSYPISQGTLALNSNYALTYKGVANLTIGTRTLSIAADPKSKTYGDIDPALTYQITGGTLAAGEAFTGSLSRAAGNDVGSYIISQGSLALNGNYVLNFTGAKLIIGARVISISADAQSKTYGAGDPALTYQITNGSLATGDAFTGSLSRTAGNEVGSYPISQGTLALNSNYALTYTGVASLTIGSRTLSIAADAKSKTYGDNDPALTYQITGGTLAAGEAFTGSLSRTAGNEAGTYAISLGSLALNSNYALIYTGSTLTIGTRAVSIAADAKSKTYGDTDPALTYKITGGTLAAGDVFSGSLSRAAGNSVGSYAISQGSLALSNNYAVTYAGADLNIDRRSLAITANDQSKVYGTANPAFTLSYNGFASGDDASSLTSPASAGTTATIHSAAGTYPINVSGYVSPNYSFTYVSGKLEISRASLTITADNKTKIQGTANPALTLSFSGFVNGETSAVLTQQAVQTTSATVSSLPGSYPIQVSGAAAANYTITLVNGSLTVSPGSPTGIALAQAPLFENQPAATPAGALSSSSADPDASFTYTLVSGAGDTDNSLFIINGDKLVISTPLNFEEKTSYSIRVRTTTANGLSFEQQFIINLSDVNEVPTIAAIADQKICYTTDQQSSPISGISAGPETSQTVSLAVSSSDSNLFESLTVSQANANGQADLKYRLKSGASGTATITVVATDNGGIENAGVNTYSRTFSITVNTPTQSMITVDKGPDVDKGDMVKLTATGGSMYSWSSARGIISGQQTAVLTVRPPFTTTYQVKITTAEGCVSVQEMTITVRDDFKNVIGNNILTPNGDGVNDKFVITNIDMYDNEIKIFDRAGRILYTKKNYANDWEGTFNNQLLAEDTYYYIVDFGPTKGKLKGFITIARD